MTLGNITNRINWDRYIRNKLPFFILALFSPPKNKEMVIKECIYWLILYNVQTQSLVMLGYFWHVIFQTRHLRHGRKYRNSYEVLPKKTSIVHSHKRHRKDFWEKLSIILFFTALFKYQAACNKSWPCYKYVWIEGFYPGQSQFAWESLNFCRQLHWLILRDLTKVFPASGVNRNPKCHILWYHTKSQMKEGALRNIGKDRKRKEKIMIRGRKQLLYVHRKFPVLENQRNYRRSLCVLLQVVQRR